MELGVILKGAGRAWTRRSPNTARGRPEPKLVYRRELGKALAESGKLDEAIAALREAVRLDPGNAEAHDFLGMYLINAKGDFDAAATEFRAHPVQTR